MEALRGFHARCPDAFTVIREEPCRYREAQNEQWCLAAKSFTISGCGGTSDMICAPSKEGHGTAADDGSPRHDPTKLANAYAGFLSEA